jgi:predicted nuclease with TOPRIM domain
VNGRAARALRRDVRRAVGADAISIIDAQTNAINQQILPNQNALQARVANVDERLTALERHAHGSDERLAEMRQSCAEEMRRLETRIVILEGMGAIHDDRIDTLQTVHRGLLPRTLSLSMRLRWLVCGR